MSNGKLLKVKEIRIEHDQFVTKIALINPHKIIAVQSGELNKQGPQLIGAEIKKELRLIFLEGGQRVFTEMTVDEIAELM